MKLFFVLATIVFSAQSYACDEWGCMKASPAVKSCIGLTQRTFNYKDNMVSPLSAAGSNCLMAERAGVLNFYMECIGRGSPRNSSSFILDCKEKAQKMVRATPPPGVPRPPVTSRDQCEMEIRRALPPQYPDATVRNYMKAYRTTSDCDSLLSCMDKAHATHNFRLETVDSCMSNPPGTSNGPTHPTSIQSSGGVPTGG